MFIKPKRIIVTGAAGFIGSHLSVRLIREGYEVIGIDNFSRGRIENLSEIISHPNFRLIEGDAGNDEILASIKADTLVHLASGKIPRFDSGWQVLRENERVSTSILQYCMKDFVRLIFASTSDVYGKNPELPFTETSDLLIGSPENKRWAYALSKLHTEFLLCAANRSSGLPFQIMRFFGCYGPKMAEGWWGGPQSVFIEQALKKTAFSIHGDGKQTRSYIYIDDLVDAVFRLVEDVELDSGIWNICGHPSTEISVVDLVKEIQSLTNPSETPEIDWIPYASFGQYEDVMRRVGSAEKAFLHLNWKAETTLREGLERTIDWVKQQKNDAESV